MLQWIDVNKPWDVHPNLNEDLRYPTELIEQKVREHFGFTKEDLRHTLENKYGCFSDILQSYEELKEELEEKGLSEEDILAELNSTEVNKDIGEYIILRGKITVFVEEIDELKTYCQNLKDTQEQEKIYREQNSFRKSPLNKPGTMIEVNQDGEIKQFVIGHINKNGGLSDEFALLNDGDIVLRATVLWEHNWYW